MPALAAADLAADVAHFHSQFHGLGRLLTYNAADFARFAGLITVLSL
ncbi:MAG: hypothetical protein ACM35G_14200 [Planctomycetaceae bacterium]